MTTELTIDQLRSRVQDFIEDGQTADSYGIGRAHLSWVPGEECYVLRLPDGDYEYEDNGCGKLIALIDDEDIQDFYEDADIAYYYEDEEAAK